jgi:transcriptional regulator of acetoin/glycerol metabolism
VRELRNALEHAVLLGGRPTLEADDLRDGLVGTSSARSAAPTCDQPRTLQAAERAHLSRILEEEGWVVPQAAKVLGLSRTSLYERIKKHGLKRQNR